MSTRCASSHRSCAELLPQRATRVCVSRRTLPRGEHRSELRLAAHSGRPREPQTLRYLLREQRHRSAYAHICTSSGGKGMQGHGGSSKCQIEERVATRASDVCLKSPVWLAASLQQKGRCLPRHWRCLSPRRNRPLSLPCISSSGGCGGVAQGGACRRKGSPH